MNINEYPEIRSGRKLVKRIYLAIFLWFTGRAIQAAARVDRDVRKEFEGLRDDFAFSLGVLPNGPYLVVGKEKGKVKYLGGNPAGKKLTLKMDIKALEAAMLVFTFQESTATGFAHDRFMVRGDLPDACAIGRVLDLVEVYLLPKVVTKLAVKRYPKWSTLSPVRKYVGRVLIYVRTIVGF